MSEPYDALDRWIDAHFDDEVRFLQALVRVPTDTPPGNNAPHAERTAELLAAMGLAAEKHAVPAAEVAAHGLQSITNLIVRRRYGDGAPVIALNAHGDVVPPGEGWTHDPYGGEIVDGRLYGRAAAVSKSDFASFTFALRALEAVARPARGAVELHFTYDEEFGGELGPGWLLRQGLTRPDLLIAAGFSYEVVTAHNGCLQMEVTLHGVASHAAFPHTGVDALQAANKLLTALYAHNDVLRERRSQVPGITHPYLNVGRIEGGSNTNVVPGRVMLKLDRRMIPEEDAAAVEAEVHRADRGRGGALARRAARDPAPAARTAAEAAARQRTAGGGARSATRRRCSAKPIPDQRHAALHRRAAVRCRRGAGGDLRRRPAHGAGVQRQAGRREPGARRPAAGDQGRRPHAGRPAALRLRLPGRTAPRAAGC